ncbi:type VII secretion target [Actinoplanes sp. NPDC020271]|uniref:type VII secretion target n=1 Tax=Actinoplanes sp. NPDC020271 TaxID=3363896 RepID=UPI0037B28668
MSAELRFPPEAILQHADLVGGASDEIAQIRAAVGEVSVSSEAYGQLCQFLPALLTPLFGSAVGVLNDATETLSETAMNLRTAAIRLTATDTANAEDLHQAASPGFDSPL